MGRRDAPLKAPLHCGRGRGRGRGVVDLRAAARNLLRLLLLQRYFFLQALLSVTLGSREEKFFFCLLRPAS
jgi:hypothetical protein